MHPIFIMLRTCWKNPPSLIWMHDAHTILLATHMMQNAPLINVNQWCTLYSSCYAHVEKSPLHSSECMMHTIWFLLRTRCKMPPSLKSTNGAPHKLHATHTWCKMPPSLMSTNDAPYIHHATHMLKKAPLTHLNAWCTPCDSCYAQDAKCPPHQSKCIMHTTLIILSTCWKMLNQILLNQWGMSEILSEWFLFSFHCCKWVLRTCTRNFIFVVQEMSKCEPKMCFICVPNVTKSLRNEWVLIISWTRNE